MAILQKLRTRPKSIESVEVVPPKSAPKAGYIRQEALPHINWNQFGPKGIEHNWVDKPMVSDRGQ